MCVFLKTIPHPTRKRLEQSGEYWGDLDVLPRTLSVPCGRCIECLKSKASSWRFRLYQEMALTPHKSAFFVTLTLSPEYYEQLGRNLPPQRYLRLFLDRWRKHFGHSCKHWFTHEYSSDNTRRLHFHGIIFDVDGFDTTKLPTDNSPASVAKRRAYAKLFDREVLRKIWKYGITFTGDHCSLDTALYVSKYISKGIYEHLKHPEVWIYPPRIYCSAGIGKELLHQLRSARPRLRRGSYRVCIGHVPYGLSRYYTQKILTPSDMVERAIFIEPVTLENPPQGKYRVLGIIYDTFTEYLEALASARTYLIANKLVRPKKKKALSKLLPNKDYGVIIDCDQICGYRLSSEEVFFARLRERDSFDTIDWYVE